MDSIQYYKEPLIDILADRISSDFKLQKDNARWRVIHSTKLAKEFFKTDFTVNSLTYTINLKTGFYIKRDDLKRCNNVNDIMKLLIKERDAWLDFLEEKKKFINELIAKYGIKKDVD